MVRIRLRRVGSKRQASYRVVVTDVRSPRDGRFIEKIGFYNPRTEPATMELVEERALYWLQNGAQPSEAALTILRKLGTLDRYDRLRKGEAMEALLAEAQGNVGTVDARTRRDDLPLPVSKKKAKARAEAEASAVEAEAPAEEAPAEEMPAEVEAPEEAEASTAEAEVEEPAAEVESPAEEAEAPAEDAESAAE